MRSPGSRVEKSGENPLHTDPMGSQIGMSQLENTGSRALNIVKGFILLTIVL